MSHLRKVALFLSLAVFGLEVTQLSSAVAPQPGPPAVDTETAKTTWTLVEANWCEGLCDRNCEECLTAYVVGCTYYWFCTDGDDGQQICTGAIGVKTGDL